MRRPFKLLLLLALITACSEDHIDKVSLQTTASDPIQQLSQLCFQHWEQQAWPLNHSGITAQQNINFRMGVEKVCQARAELYAEGYEIVPFIAEHNPRELYALVFSADVESIKAHLKRYLPQLRII